MQGQGFIAPRDAGEAQPSGSSSYDLNLAVPVCFLVLVLG